MNDCVIFRAIFRTILLKSSILYLGLFLSSSAYLQIQSARYSPLNDLSSFGIFLSIGFIRIYKGFHTSCRLHGEN